IAFHHEGAIKELRARREVVLSGGAFGSPQLLMLSGIGPADELQRHGIKVAHVLPGVGKNLQDHIDYIQTYRCASGPETFGLSFGGIARITRAIGEWRRDRTGPVTSPFAESGAFMKVAPDALVPDMQLIF